MEVSKDSGVGMRQELASIAMLKRLTQCRVITIGNGLDGSSACPF